MIYSGDISERQFRQVRDWLYQRSGIYLQDCKRSLVSGRLLKRLRYLNLPSFDPYLQIICNLQRCEEQQIALNLLTTNETYFFREEKHFDFLRKLLQQQIFCSASDLKIWSAAASSGEEAYSIAMILAQERGLHRSWQVDGTDINTKVIQQAQTGIYPIERSSRIDMALLKKYCVKGKGKDEGWFRMKPEMLKRVNFGSFNLMRPAVVAAKYDVIFLRNVLIYFELTDKKRIVANVVSQLKHHGYLLVGHSESIHGYDARLQQIQPGCYRLRL